MSAADKFAHVAAFRSTRAPRSAPQRGSPTSPEFDSLAQLLNGQTRSNRYGEHLSFRQWHASPEMCAPNKHSLSLLLPAAVKNRQAMLELTADPTRWLFLDTETTGLAGGTGTYAFLVGIAWWDAGGLQVEQLFMRDLDEEHSVLLELAERMSERPVLVTFNGKSFDWPLLETRYRMTRSISCAAPKAHLDMLHPARQLWRPRLGSVRLKELEWHVLGGEDRTLAWSRHDDIDSTLIPQMYFDYLRGGSAQPLAGVLRHNQMDLRGLAALVGKVCAFFDLAGDLPCGEPQPARHPVDLYALSRLLHRRGKPDRARTFYTSALVAGLPAREARQAQRQLARLAKQDGDYARATPLWEQLCQVPDSQSKNDAAADIVFEDGHLALETAVEAAEQLAIYYEHRAKKPQRAAELTRAAISEIHAACTGPGRESSRARKLEARLTRRLTRLERVGAGGKPAKASLLSA